MAKLEDSQTASQYNVWNGWNSRKTQVGLRGAYGWKKEWTAERLREAWMWEANMNEETWGYGNEPDWNLDLSIGQALPGQLGGIVFGYSPRKGNDRAPGDQTLFLG